MLKLGQKNILSLYNLNQPYNAEVIEYLKRCPLGAKHENH